MNIALVTGASAGFGAAICRHLAAAGWRVIGAARRAGETVSVPCSSDPRLKPARAFLDYTCDAPPGLWFNRKWETIPATLAEGRVTADLPSGAKAWYVSVETADGSRVSTPVDVR